MRRECRHLLAMLILGALPSRAAVTVVTLGPSYTVGLGQTRDIDINSDGTFDFTFGGQGAAGASLATFVTPLNGAQLLFDPGFGDLTSITQWIAHWDTFTIGSVPQLIPGGPGSEYLAIVTFRWVGGTVSPYLSYDDALSGSGGPFYNQSSGLMGFSFLAADGRHYGYFDLGTIISLNVLLNSYSYETTPYAPLSLYGAGAPEPHRAVLLAASIVALVLRRRRALGAG